MPSDGELGAHAEAGIAIAHAKASKGDVTSNNAYENTLYQRLAGSVAALFVGFSIVFVLLENRIAALLCLFVPFLTAVLWIWWRKIALEKRRKDSLEQHRAGAATEVKTR